MDEETLSLLEFPELLELVQRFAQSGAGRARIGELRPQRDPDAIRQVLDEVEEAVRFLSEQGRPSQQDLDDPGPVLERLAWPGEVLEAGECLVLWGLLRSSLELERLFSPLGPGTGTRKWPRLARSFSPLTGLERPLRSIERVLAPSGEVREAAFPELAEARRRQARFRQRVQEQLRGYLESSRGRPAAQDNYLTVRNGRYVIPVKLEHQREVPGLVHGASSSGATVFVEPFSVVDLNNQVLYYGEREAEILRQALFDLSQGLRAELPLLREAAERLTRVDALFACAAFSRAHGCSVPRLNTDRTLVLREARHPLLVQSMGPEKVVPLFLELSPRDNVLVISGPNAGGKTVALKTVGLLCLMAQSGLPVPAASAELPVFQEILADIGDHQSIAQHLSTFTAHVLRMKTMLGLPASPTLILLDEIGAGTDPVYGAALGIALLDHFRKRGSLVVATTHHPSLKQFAGTTAGVMSAGVGLDEKTLRPTYVLEFGTAGTSSSLEIASLLGLPASVIQAARRLLTERDLQIERYLKELHRELENLKEARRQAEGEREALRRRERELAREFEKRERQRRQDTERALEEWAEAFRRETERYVKTLRDGREAARVRTDSRRRQTLLKEAFRKKMAAAVAPPDSEGPAQPDTAANWEWREGDSVYHTFFRKQGKLLKLRGAEAVVEIEGKRIGTPADQLRRVDEEPLATAGGGGVSVQAEDDVAPELNLIGASVDEALRLTDKYLDQAFLSQMHQVRIIHGFGTGRLKAALSEFLKGHPHVLEYDTEGGATRVSLRQ